MSCLGCPSLYCPCKLGQFIIASVSCKLYDIQSGLFAHFPEIQLMKRAIPENLHALCLLFRGKISANLIGVCGPLLAGETVIFACVVPDQRPIECLLYILRAFQKLPEDPMVADHTGQARHQTFCYPAVFCSFQHTVRVGFVFRALR